MLTAAQRRLNMSRVRGRDTRPEMIVRRGLHALGHRFRLHRRDLPGRPDLVMPAHRAALFVHGCFWHGHECPLFRLPSTRRDFWATKIAGNRTRDKAAVDDLRNEGWRTAIVWECSLRGRGRLPPGEVIAALDRFVRGSQGQIEIAGSPEVSTHVGP